MCGIAGVVHRHGSVIADPTALASTLSQSLAHRGPDGGGQYVSPDHDALLVHRRLAIIDPTAAADQPMTTVDRRHVIVFNGEIYNYRELRRELEGRGHTFRTSSDTEVLLRLLIVHGPEALARARGMFALAWWNAETGTLLLARDRFGIKPLYVATRPGAIAFASEQRALRAAGLVDAQPTASAVLAFLSWGSVPPPLAWNGGVEALESGCWFEWRQDGRELRGRFADARTPYISVDAPFRSEADFRTAIGAAVRDSVHAHLVADVPVGVFLSGGIDSGAIVSAAVSAGAANLQTFTVAFDDKTSEASRARGVAKKFGTHHHELHVDASHVADDLPAVLAHLDQPSIDAVNSFYVSRAVAATGIKAVLSGTGGDELFGGYPSFERLPRALHAKRLAGPLWPMIDAGGRAVLPRRLQARWRQFVRTPGTVAAAYRIQRGFLMPAEIDALAGPALLDTRTSHDAHEQLERAEAALLDAAGPEQTTASIARLESRMYLQSQLLRDIDVMAMAHGLEVRVPFVDHVLVGAVWPELGRHRSLLRGKQLLHATLDRPLPSAVVDHPKQGFTLPFARWMRGDLAGVVQHGLSQLASRGWIAADAPSRLWNDWISGTTHWSRPWGLSVLGAFLQS